MLSQQRQDRFLLPLCLSFLLMACGNDSGDVESNVLEPGQPQAIADIENPSPVLEVDQSPDADVGDDAIVLDSALSMALRSCPPNVVQQANQKLIAKPLDAFKSAVLADDTADFTLSGVYELRALASDEHVADIRIDASGRGYLTPVVENYAIELSDGAMKTLIASFGVDIANYVLKPLGVVIEENRLQLLQGARFPLGLIGENARASYSYVPDMPGMDKNLLTSQLQVYPDGQLMLTLNVDGEAFEYSGERVEREIEDYGFDTIGSYSHIFGDYGIAEEAIYQYIADFDPLARALISDFAWDNELLSPVVMGVATVYSDAPRTYSIWNDGHSTVYAVLTDDEVNTVTVNFSEPIVNHIPADELLIWNSGKGEYIDIDSMAWDETQRFLTIHLSEPLHTSYNKPATMHIYLLASSFLDASGNSLSDQLVDEKGQVYKLPYVEYASPPDKTASYIRVALGSYFDPITDAPRFALEQVLFDPQSSAMATLQFVADINASYRISAFQIDDSADKDVIEASGWIPVKLSGDKYEVLNSTADHLLIGGALSGDVVEFTVGADEDKQRANGNTRVMLTPLDSLGNGGSVICIQLTAT